MEIHLEKFFLHFGNPESKSSDCAPIDEVQVRVFDNEIDMLCEFANFVRSEKFNIVIGYNIMGFDFKYMMNRAHIPTM